MKARALPTRLWIMLIALIALAGALGLAVSNAPSSATAAQPPPPTPMNAAPPHREVSGDVQAPAISFIDSPSATCSRPVAGTGACYIEWNYLYVTAAPSSYVISMTVSIDNRIRAYHTGFFQSSMYIPVEMTAPGYKVTCGRPGSGSNALWGKTYNYILRARDSAGLSATNYGSVTCPADEARIFLPVMQKR